MDQYSRRIIGFGVHAGTLNGVALCKMFNRAIRGQLWMPKYITSDNDPMYRFQQWRANLRILEVTEIKSPVPSFRGCDLEDAWLGLLPQIIYNPRRISPFQLRVTLTPRRLPP
jgi:hypothetical protein